MELFVSWATDKDRDISRSVLTDDVVAVRLAHQSVDLANNIWESFALRSGGSIVEVSGDHGTISFDSQHLQEVARLAHQYGKAIDATVSIGIGGKLSESAKAILIAKLRGGDKILLWRPEMDQELVDHKKPAHTLFSKNIGGAGSAGRTIPTTQDHSQGAEAQKAVDAAPAPYTPTTNQDLEELLHGAAQTQETHDQNEVIQQDGQKEQIKAQLIQILQNVRANLPAIQQIGQARPEVAQSIMQLLAGVVALGREVTGSSLQKAIQDIKPGTPAHGGEVDYSHLLPPETKKQYKLKVHQSSHAIKAYVTDKGTGEEAGHVLGITSIPKGELEPHSYLEKPHRGKGLGIAMYEAVYKHAKDGGFKKISGGNHSTDAHAVHQRLVEKHGFEYKPKSNPDYDREVYPYGKYQYALKNESAIHNEEDSIMDGSGPLFFEKDGLEKAISSIRPGSKINDDGHTTGPGIPGLKQWKSTYDYSHMLSEEQKKEGLQLQVHHFGATGPGDKAVYENIEAQLSKYDQGRPLYPGDTPAKLGNVKGIVRPKGSKKTTEDAPRKETTLEPHSQLLSTYHGRGLGTLMYEAVYAHAKHVVGIDKVQGSVHSPMAHALHTRLSKKHGFEYNAPREEGVPDTDYPYMPYKYTLKNEFQQIEDAGIIGPGHGPIFFKNLPAAELDKTAMTETKHNNSLPVGTLKGHKMKVQHADGSKGWVGVGAGMIQAQEAGAPFGGANSHPVSSLRPGSK